MSQRIYDAKIKPSMFRTRIIWFHATLKAFVDIFGISYIKINSSRISKVGAISGVIFKLKFFIPSFPSFVVCAPRENNLMMFWVLVSANPYSDSSSPLWTLDHCQVFSSLLHLPATPQTSPTSRQFLYKFYLHPLPSPPRLPTIPTILLIWYCYFNKGKQRLSTKLHSKGLLDISLVAAARSISL